MFSDAAADPAAIGMLGGPGAGQSGRKEVGEMLFGRKASTPIQVGDRFVKAGIRFGTVWEIVRVWTTGDQLLHARLNSVENHGETLAVSVKTLVDRQFFMSVPRPVSSVPGAVE